MPVRWKDKRGRRGRFAATLSDWTSSVAGTYANATTHLGRIDGLVLDFTASLVGVSQGSALRSGVIASTLANWTGSFVGTEDYPPQWTDVLGNALSFTTGSAWSYTFTATDVDGDPITFLDGSGTPITAATTLLTGITATPQTQSGNTRDLVISGAASITAGPHTVNVDLAGQSFAAQDWASRSQGPGVVWAHNFEHENEVSNFLLSPGIGNDPTRTWEATRHPLDVWHDPSDGFAGGGSLVIQVPAADEAYERSVGQVNSEVYDNGGWYGGLRDSMSVQISAIAKSNPCQITTATPHYLSTGDSVRVRNVVGMTQINHVNGVTTPPTVTVTGANTLTLNGINSTGYSTYVSGGIIGNDRPGVPFGRGVWRRPYSPLLTDGANRATGSGRGVNDPAANGTITRRAWNPVGTASLTSNFKHGVYAHADGPLPSGWTRDGDEFYIQYRMKVPLKRFYSERILPAYTGAPGSRFFTNTETRRARQTAQKYLWLANLTPGVQTQELVVSGYPQLRTSDGGPYNTGETAFLILYTAFGPELFRSQGGAWEVPKDVWITYLHRVRWGIHGVSSLTNAINASQTTFSVDEPTRFDSTPFTCTLTDGTQSEVILVSGISGNVFTVTRNYNGVGAKSFAAGSVINNGQTNSITGDSIVEWYASANGSTYVSLGSSSTWKLGYALNTPCGGNCFEPTHYNNSTDSMTGAGVAAFRNPASNAGAGQPYATQETYQNKFTQIIFSTQYIPPPAAGA